MNARKASAPLRPSPQLQWEIEQFLYAEAALLDERRIDEWLTLMADDVQYRMPVVTNLQPGGTPMPGHESFGHFEDSKESLRIRVKRLNTGLVPAENPPARMRRFVSNVRITDISASGEHEVQCLFILKRTRLDWQLDLFHGARTDVLRRADTPLGWQVARRTIYIDQSLVPSYNLNTLF